jgi:hypothetical protein
VWGVEVEVAVARERDHCEWIERKRTNNGERERERVEVYYSEEKKGFTTRKLSNTNINTNRNNIISKLQ